MVAVYYIYENHWLGMGIESSSQVNGRTAAVEYLTGYLVEKSLSLDNIFVIALIFSFFHVPLQYQHRVLFWGILGALIMRGLMIGAGVALIKRFHWIIYVFGGFLIFTAFKMLFAKEEKPHLEDNRVIKLARRLFPVSPQLDGHAFFTHWNGRRAVTPLFLVLLLVESMDIIFAVDSIPAIFGVTQDPFIVFTSNIFAILGLRSLYFALAKLLDQFRYLHLSLVAILAYIGAKMLLSGIYHISSWVSLCIIGGIVFLGIFASILRSRWETSKHSGYMDKPPKF
jgi:tellurite resistance protein TerC